MKARVRMALATTAVLAGVAALVVGVGGPAHADLVWPGYDRLVAHNQRSVGSVTAMVEIFTGSKRNSYYGKVNCVNTNPGPTAVRASHYGDNRMSGFIESQNANKGVAIMDADTSYRSTNSYGFSRGFYAWNDTLSYFGGCEYLYNGKPGTVVVPFADKWVGYYV